jgi:hypothetical protein
MKFLRQIPPGLTGFAKHDYLLLKFSSEPLYLTETAARRSLSSSTWPPSDSFTSARDQEFTVGAFQSSDSSTKSCMHVPVRELEGLSKWTRSLCTEMNFSRTVHFPFPQLGTVAPMLAQIRPAK